MPVNKNNLWHENIESRVPLLSDHQQSKKRMKGKRIEPGDSLQKVPHKNTALTNVFLQSDMQNQLRRGKNFKSFQAPLTHKSLGKKVETKDIYAGRPIFGGNQPGNHVQNGQAGRARDFHSSFIF